MRPGTPFHAALLAVMLLPAGAGAQSGSVGSAPPFGSAAPDPPVPTGAAAEVADDDPIPAAVPSRVEIGGGGGLMVAYPEVSVLASIPVGPTASFEVAAGWMPRVIYEVEHGLAQAQVRLPFRSYLRSRRSLLLGVTRVSTRKRHPYDHGFWGDDATTVFPHAGVSLQWPIGRHADFRFDAQGLFTMAAELPLIPRAAATFVWHP